MEELAEHGVFLPPNMQGLEIGIAELRCNVRGKEVGEKIQS